MTFVDMKTAELIGAPLDWAAAKAIGEEYRPATTFDGIGTEYPAHQFSTDWSQGGPLIEQYKIELLYFGSKGFNGNPWEAQRGVDAGYIDQYPGWAVGGSTPLIAAMRCLVASEMGNTVQVPEELL